VKSHTTAYFLVLPRALIIYQIQNQQRPKTKKQTRVHSHIYWLCWGYESQWSYKNIPPLSHIHTHQVSRALWHSFTELVYLDMSYMPVLKNLHIQSRSVIMSSKGLN